MEVFTPRMAVFDAVVDLDNPPHFRPWVLGWFCERAIPSGKLGADIDAWQDLEEGIGDKDCQF